MADKPKIISQGKLQKPVTADANERAVAPSRAMRWVSAAAFFEVLNCAEATGRLGAYAIKGGFAVELCANVQARFNQVEWGTLKIDVIDAEIADVERVENVAIERFGLPRVGSVACLSRPHQIAEWIHCITRPEIDGKHKNRARNIIDVYLFDTLATTDDETVRDACLTTFERERTHAWPPIPAFPEAWAATRAEVVEEIGLESTPRGVIAYVTAYIRRLAR